MYRKFFSVIILLSLLISAHVEAADFKVPEDYLTIQSAIDAATPGDTISVSPGTYIENINFSGKAVSLQSTEGPDVTIIEPTVGTAVTIGPSGEFSGFTIRNGSASFGAGMRVSGSGSRIFQNVFDSNHQGAGGFGAGIGGNSASPIIEKNIFLNNTCDNQFLSGVVSFVNSSSPRIVNNIFFDNPCRAINFTLPSSGMPVTINNTIVRNRVGIRVDRRIATSQQKYRNNIIMDNDIGLEVDFGSEFNNPTWEHNLVYNNIVNYDEIPDQTGVFGNISSDPLFTDALANDFSLLSRSAAIDTGTQVDAPNDDYEGNSRPIDGNGDGVAEFDIGAYEFQYTSIPVGIDIKPDNQVNNINPRSSGSLTVAILTSEVFDALQVNPDTVQFGPANAKRVHNQAHVEDIDYDGDMDLLVHFWMFETGIQCGDTEAVLTAETWGGAGVSGTDSINTKGCE